MFFNSYEFIFILLPISLFLYWGSCYFNLKKYANLTLLIISIIFYINLTDIIGIYRYNCNFNKYYLKLFTI